MTESRRTMLRWTNDFIRDFVSIAWFVALSRSNLASVRVALRGPICSLRATEM